MMTTSESFHMAQPQPGTPRSWPAVRQESLRSYSKTRASDVEEGAGTPSSGDTPKCTGTPVSYRSASDDTDIQSQSDRFPVTDRGCVPLCMFVDRICSPGQVLPTDSTRAGLYDLSTVNLTYKVKVKGSKEKTLLHNVTATARHGEILAVAGPSGAGKSTFLDAAAGKIRRSSLNGEILYNGKPVDAIFKQLSGYVMQDDQLFPHLTVRETLLYSARLRIPNHVSNVIKTARVDTVIQELGLTKCADTIIGNEQVRGVSGGEKRRVSIGVDLIHDPAVLFLDEPTSGLDSVAALSVVRILRDLAEQQQRTVVLTIHQPSFRILELIHNYLILAQGRVVYHGPYQGMAERMGAFRKHWGGDQGLGWAQRANNLEYALDVIETAARDEQEMAALLQYAEEQQAQREVEIAARAKEEGGCGGGNEGMSDEELSLSPQFATGFLSETAVLLGRCFKNILRTRELFLTRFATFVLCGVIVGLLYFHLPTDISGVSGRVKYFGFGLMAMIFTATDALPVFLNEREIFKRETSRGAYRASAYVVSQTLAFLPTLLLTALTNLVQYFMVGLAPGLRTIAIHISINFLTLSVANSFVLFIGGFVSNFANGVTIGTAINAFFFLCSGFFLETSKIPPYLMWLNWLSTFKYPLQMMMVNQMNALSTTCWDPPLPDGTKPQPCVLTSEEVLKGLDMQDVNMAVNALIMLSFFLGYRILFYICLTFHTRAVRK